MRRTEHQNGSTMPRTEPENRRKPRQIQASDAEWLRIKDMAKAVDKSISEFLRQSVLPENSRADVSSMNPNAVPVAAALSAIEERLAMMAQVSVASGRIEPNTLAQLAKIERFLGEIITRLEADRRIR
jgi:hypothetical protein